MGSVSDRWLELVWSKIDLMPGSFTMEDVWYDVAYLTGDTIGYCLDRMAEKGKIEEITGPEVKGRLRAFVKISTAANTSIPDIHSMLSIIEEFRDKSIN